MALYIMAMSINPDAKKQHPDISHHVSNSLEAFKLEDVKIVDLYATLGRYDFLAVFEAVEQADAFKVASDINSQGILKTETWPVIPYEDFSQLIG